MDFSVWHMGTGSASTANFLRIVGFDATTTYADTGHGIAFLFAGNLSNNDTRFLGNYVHHTGKPLDWKAEDGPGYRVGPLYFQGFGPHGRVEIGWCEFAYNNGQSQFFGHYSTDRINELHYHDNEIHHTSTPPWIGGAVAVSAVFGGGDANSTLPYC
ncbi:MAG TPA: hypothetical protein VI754_16120 [Bacteriovoracaceae bacterium]|nr:hypothetical protein [Bacteriovoracaceae bacterium]